MINANFYALTAPALTSYLQTKQYSSYVTSQLLSWVYKHQHLSMEQWMNVSKKLRAQLCLDFSFELPLIESIQRSIDGTTKFLLRFNDGEGVESVLIPTANRLTQCLSTQVGCAMKCAFCFSGSEGPKRNLQAHEIVGQYIAVNRFLLKNPIIIPEDPLCTYYPKITNLVFMGQGEPLNNYEEVKRATTIFLEPQGIAFGQRKVTLSTCGVVPKILLLNEFPPVNLAVSLHSPRDAIRDQLMPINRSYNLEKLFTALNQLSLKAYRRITYEYLLIDELTNTPEDLELLIKLLIRERSKINLIPFNEYPGHSFKRPSDEKNLWFCNELGKHGFTATIRQSKGRDILAACGQLKATRTSVITTSNC
ncbi:MAG: 23S rRNA (adenine(2503)-C(2))-methyltransferase RlmN [Oligoflexia bacterium]|nr:23S rRNA (adenine(2503)-C(2))-methyltransferase RlmN [Oligoflexia bacterium]